MTRIYLIRHAEAEGNLYRRCQGQYNALVTDRGLRQIAALRERFREIPVDAVWSSDLYRTMKTASAVYETHGLTLHTHPGLREVGVGVWENQPWGAIGRNDREQLGYFNTNDPRWHVEGSETFPILRDRLMGTLGEIAAQHEGQTIAVVSHGMALRNLMAGLQGLSVPEGANVPHSDNTGVSLVEYEGGRGRVVFQNENTHLTQELSTFAGLKWWKKNSGFWEDANLWYEPLDPVTEGEFLRECHREAWLTIHGTLDGFDGDFALEQARRQHAEHPGALWRAMLGDEPAGVLQLDMSNGAARGIGHISFLYILPKFRGQGMGVQLIGQAVAQYRPLGRDKLGLCCAPENTAAQGFYKKYGFQKIGETAGSRGPLDLMVKDIGFYEL